MKKQITILLTCCLGDYMKGTINCYKNNPDGVDVRVVGTDMNPMTYNFTGVDAFYQVSRCTDENYLYQIRDICEKENVDVLIPCNTKELEMFSRNAEMFESTRILISPYVSLHIANDKIRSHQFFKETGIPTPLTLCTGSYDEFKKFLERYESTTFCFKQRNDCGSRGFRIITKTSNVTLDEKPNGVEACFLDLKKFFDKGEEYIVQKYLYGEEYTVDCVADHGKVLCSVCKINKNMENGVARISEVVNHKGCIEMCEEVCHRLGLHGNIGFDLKTDSGNLYIIDVNPRLTATVALAEKAGVNLPYLALGLAFDCEYTKNFNPTIKYGTKLIRKITDYYFDEEGNLIG